MKIKEFMKNLKAYGIKYAFCVRFMFTFEHSKIKFLKKFSSKCYDYAEDFYNQHICEYDYEAEEELRAEWALEDAVYGNGCHPDDCVYCGSYPACDRWTPENIDTAWKLYEEKIKATA